ncbi:MAG: hypothetical protein US70_C0011G0015 [Parcubacteria group bacterium GW2011_GWD2_38_11]|nr:MAG: hypothetical protein US70_C0011G0015 [Parcubacteria group bacterium GW2011_GWD2_38_11]
MKNKFSLFAIIFIASLFVVSSSSASSRRNDGPCSGRFWSDECQEFIHTRDHINNIKQIPRNRIYHYGYRNNERNYSDLRFDYPNLNFDYDF